MPSGKGVLEDDVQRIRSLVAEGYSLTAVARITGFAWVTVWRRFHGIRQNLSEMPNPISLRRGSRRSKPVRSGGCVQCGNPRVGTYKWKFCSTKCADQHGAGRRGYYLRLADAAHGRYFKRPGSAVPAGTEIEVHTRSFSDDDVMHIRRRVHDGESIRSVAASLNQQPASVQRLVAGECYRHLPVLEGVTRTCPYCGTVFHRPRRVGKVSVHCSRKCRVANEDRHVRRGRLLHRTAQAAMEALKFDPEAVRPDRRPKVYRVCAHCERRIELGQGGYRYCNDACRDAASKQRARKPPRPYTCRYCEGNFLKEGSGGLPICCPDKECIRQKKREIHRKARERKGLKRRCGECRVVFYTQDRRRWYHNKKCAAAARKRKQLWYRQGKRPPKRKLQGDGLPPDRHETLPKIEARSKYTKSVVMAIRKDHASGGLLLDTAAKHGLTVHAVSGIISGFYRPDLPFLHRKCVCGGDVPKHRKFCSAECRSRETLRRHLKPPRSQWYDDVRRVGRVRREYAEGKKMLSDIAASAETSEATLLRVLKGELRPDLPVLRRSCSYCRKKLPAGHAYPDCGYGTACRTRQQKQAKEDSRTTVPLASVAHLIRGLSPGQLAEATGINRCRATDYVDDLRKKGRRLNRKIAEQIREALGGAAG